MLTNYASINKQLAEQAKSCGRNPNEVTLIAVSKTVGLQEVESAIDEGAHDFGENRPEELVRKSQAFPNENWHFIGNIQSRQIKNIVPNACMIHSLFKFEHAEKIDRVAKEIGKIQKVLIEVNVSGESSKSGVHSGDLPEFLKACKDLENISICGLMTMAPIEDAAHANLPSALEVFRSAHDLLEANRDQAGSQFCEFSAGMTNDWPDAVKCGSTFIRVGRAIFDPDMF